MALGVAKTSLNRQKNRQGKANNTRATGILAVIDQNVKTILPQTVKNKNIPSQTVGRAKIDWTLKDPAKNCLGSNKNKLKQTEKRTRQTTPLSHGHTGCNRPKCKNYTAANGKKQKYTFPNGRKSKNRPDKRNSGEKWP
jgi:hypothetical protein